MIGFLYAGQGSQVVGMGQDIYDALPAAKNLWDRWPHVRDVAFSGPSERLNETVWCQPAMALFAISVTEALASAGVRPQVAAGLSLGEYSALAAAGVYTPEQVMRILTVRAAAMQTACAYTDGAMYAVLGLDHATVEAVCAAVHRERGGVVAVANDNTPLQQVIGGDREAVDAAALRLKEAGARRCVPLTVSGAFHTPLMHGVQGPLAVALSAEAVAEPVCDVYGNVSAAPLVCDDVRTELTEQPVATVRMTETLKAMEAAGVDVFVEIGPGKVLAGFVRQTLGRDRVVYSVETLEDLQKVIEELGGSHAN